MSAPVLRVGVLYPELLNIYADRGNLLVLERRCAWRGIGVLIRAVTIGEPLRAEDHDLFYLGGGQDSDQRRCADDLVATKRDALHEAAGAGRVVLGVCGGYQLLGHGYLADGQRLPGIDLLDVSTVATKGPRLVGNAAVAVEVGGRRRVLTGFENHRGRTSLGPTAHPLGRVVHGHGNNGEDGTEGAWAGTVLGTYLHGPLLAVNAWFADWLVATALGRDVEALPALADGLEQLAHDRARQAAAGEGR